MASRGGRAGASSSASTELRPTAPKSREYFKRSENKDSLAEQLKEYRKESSEEFNEFTMFQTPGTVGRTATMGWHLYESVVRASHYIKEGLQDWRYDRVFVNQMRGIGEDFQGRYATLPSPFKRHAELSEHIARMIFGLLDERLNLGKPTGELSVKVCGALSQAIARSKAFSESGWTVLSAADFVESVALATATSYLTVNNDQERGVEPGTEDAKQGV